MAITDAQREMMHRVLTHGWTRNFVLRNGSRGQTVRALQLFLKDNGQDISADGVFGPQTEAALRQFQKTAATNTDGIAGSRTMKAITDRLGPPPIPQLRPPPPESLATAGTTSSAGTSMQAPPLPTPRPVMDVMNQDGPTSSFGKTAAMPPLPNMRGAPVVPASAPQPGLLTPRDLLGPPPSGPAPAAPAPSGLADALAGNTAPPTFKIASDGNADAWLPVNNLPGGIPMVAGARRNSMDAAAGFEPGHRPVMGLDPSQLPVAQTLMNADGPKAWEPGYWRQARFAAGLPPPTPTSPSQPPQVAQATDPLQQQVQGDVAWFRNHLARQGADPATIAQKTDAFAKLAWLHANRPAAPQQASLTATPPMAAPVVPPGQMAAPVPPAPSPQSILTAHALLERQRLMQLQQSLQGGAPQQMPVAPLTQ